MFCLPSKFLWSLVSGVIIKGVSKSLTHSVFILCAVTGNKKKIKKLKIEEQSLKVIDQNMNGAM